jgi:hypothetical protein
LCPYPSPSASNSIPTRSTSRRARATGRAGCGTFNAGPACGSSSATTTMPSRRSPSAPTVATSLAQVRPAVGASNRLNNADLLPPPSPAAEDHAINIWDLGSARLIKKMTGHTSSIHSLSFSAESSLLVSGGADCTVRVWDVKSSAQEADGVFGGPPVKESAVATRRSSKAGPVAGSTLGELPMNDVPAGDDPLNAHVVSDIRSVGPFPADPSAIARLTLAILSIVVSQRLPSLHLPDQADVHPQRPLHASEPLSRLRLYPPHDLMTPCPQCDLERGDST